MRLKLEHIAFNVADPEAMTSWYVKNLGLEVTRKVGGSHRTHFLSDYSGAIMIEIYNNPPDQVPDYSLMDPLLVHLAFVSENPARDKTLLINEGATFVDEIFLEDGSHLVMHRDPWGLAVQLCKRGRPMLTRY